MVISGKSDPSAAPDKSGQKHGVDSAVLGRTLAIIDSWPVDNVCAAIVDRTGILASRGATDRVFELASVTKLLVSYAALIAVEEEAIDLDEPAGPPGSTVRHLLAHASGTDFGTEKIRASPGTRRIYSSAGFELLAQHISERTEIPFAEYLQEAVFASLRMDHSSLDGPAGHGARSTVADLARFAADLIEPSLIDGSTMAEAVSEQFPGLNGVVPGFGMAKPCPWGLGFEIKGEKDPHWTADNGSPATFGHFGQSGTFLWVDPAVELALVVLTDRDFGSWAPELWRTLSADVLAQFPLNR